MTLQQLLADTLRQTATLLGRYLKGFDDTNHTRQAPGLPNHVAWCLGHLSLTLQRTAEKLDDQPPSPEFFVEGSIGDARRFGVEQVGFASHPVDDPSIYPSFARCVEIFERSSERAATAFEIATNDKLETPVRWGSSDVPIWTLATRLAFHNGTHCGQITDLRRAFGFESVFK